MPWWGGAALAYDFALEVYGQLGTVFQGSYGPVFAFDYNNSADSGEVYGVAHNTLAISDQINLDPTDPLAASLTYPYAYARAYTPVPAPMPLFGDAAAFGWARRLRNNRKLPNSKVCRMNQAGG